ncbi:dTMP kinase [Kitasatospora xanthocidica]|uniref:Thymidylate kinase n=1 Tax=Kitasatospora xanthocidica TaxID=83382 RepID=A0A372ZX30_9ACTN|nr:dTMP kinase [Kitasatospora xanthocidica]RGD60389.1 dTMP kinase [Kitasatospora xanthocidica]
MTSEEQPTPSAVPAARARAFDLPEVAPAGSPADRARALLRTRAYRRLWTTQLIGGTADRLGLLVLLALTVIAAAQGGQFGSLPRSLAFALAAVLAVRVLATGLVGVALLGPVHRLVTGRLDRRWTLFGADVLRALLIGLAPWWSVWLGSAAKPSGAAVYVLLATVFVTGAAERVWGIAKSAAVPGLLPPANPHLPAAEQRPAAANLDSVRSIDRFTGWVTVPLGAVGLVAFTLLNNIGAAVGSDWLRAHQLTFAALGAAGLFAASAVRGYLQQLPGGPVTVAPVSPFQGLRAPTDATPGPALGKGRTGSAPYFTFAVAAGYASMAGVAALALLTAAEHRAGPIGYGLLVLAAAGTPALGTRLTRATLPSLSRRRLLALALLTQGVALILAGLVLDFVLVLLLTVLAGLAAGIVVSAGRTLLAQEVEEARLPKVTEHLFAVLRAVVAAALVVVPLIAAAYGDVEYGTVEPGSFTFIHGGAALAVATSGLLTLVLAAVVLLRTDDRRGTAPFVRDLVDSVRGAGGPVPHQGAGTGFFIALEGGDGAGKSTQAQALAEWIRGKGHEVVLTREPGGSPVGQRLRGLVLDVGNTGLSHRAEALIYAADRAEHVENVIRPALARGAVVITDRYMDSSIAYQGAGRDLAATEVSRISRWATGGLLPDLTVVLDVDPTRARERFTEALDRLESEPTEFHQRVRAGFLSLAAADPARYLVVDGSQAPDFVTTAIRHRLDRELPLSEQEKAARAEQERLAKEEAERRAAEEARKKAEEEAAERKRQEVLAQLRAEQAEKERLAKEEAERAAAEARRKAEEEARRRAAEEAERRAAEEAKLRAAEEARLAAEAVERKRIADEAAAQAELQRQRELAREEQRRRAEEALQRAEEARLAQAAALAAAAAAAESAEGRAEGRPGSGSGSGSGSAGSGSGSASGEATTELRAVRDIPKDAPRDAAQASAQVSASAPSASSAQASSGGLGDEATRELSPRDRQAAVRAAEAAEARKAAEARRAAGAVDETTRLPVVPASAVDETAVLPKVPAEADRTAVLPRIEPGRVEGRTDGRAEGRAEGRAAQAPRRAEPVDSTRELPVIGAEPASGPPSQPQPQPAAERPRPEWAEETPMDDLPSLTDTLLGSHDEWARWEHGGPGQGGSYGGPQSGAQGGAERPEGRGNAQGEGDGKGKGRRWGRRG